ncbi:MAG: hypothetical protein A2026_03705 [Deltaproteobacteria bacterium RBG_19FT_COMBO_46_12]|nr:MAG: hypothetical protein A2026_03705 [Deltaproteobacteria bacterium RBG_19FT_COMBO_46_12]
MSTKIVEDDFFASPFTGRVYRVRKIHLNSVVIEEVGNEKRQLLTEKGTIVHFYEKVIEQHIPNFLAEERKS